MNSCAHGRARGSGGGGGIGLHHWRSKCALCIVHCALCIVHCALCIVTRNARNTPGTPNRYYTFKQLKAINPNITNIMCEDLSPNPCPHHLIMARHCRPLPVALGVAAARVSLALPPGLVLTLARSCPPARSQRGTLLWARGPWLTHARPRGCVACRARAPPSPTLQLAACAPLRADLNSMMDFTMYVKKRGNTNPRVDMECGERR